MPRVEHMTTSERISNQAERINELMDENDRLHVELFVFSVIGFAVGAIATHFIDTGNAAQFADRALNSIGFRWAP